MSAIFIMASQQASIISMVMPPIGFISQTIIFFSILQVISHIMGPIIMPDIMPGIIIGICIGIMPPIGIIIESFILAFCIGEILSLRMAVL